MNDIKLLGRLSHEPEIKKTTSGREYTWFTVAVPRKNDRNEADFIRCVAFDKLAVAVHQYCGKGRQVLVHGRLQVSTTDKDNERKYYHTVIAHATHFLHDPNQEQANAEVPF